MHVEGGTVSSRQAVSIDLIVTELVINALSHAFPGDRSDGPVVVTYELAEPNWRLTVSDNGIGQPEGQLDKTNSGFDTTIIEVLAPLCSALMVAWRTPTRKRDFHRFFLLADEGHFHRPWARWRVTEVWG